MALKHDGQENRQLATVFSLAVLGFVFVISVAFFSFVFDRAGEDGSGSSGDQTPLVVEKEVEKTYEFDSDGYGIKVEELMGWKASANIIALTEDGASAVDCRKMSASMRENLTSGSNACYELTLKNDQNDSSLVITTGDEFYKDPRESYNILDDSTGVREYPDAQVNLPLERIYVSKFPVNFVGVKVNYPSGASFNYYKGVVYKGADKYALVVVGDLNEEVRQLLGQLDLE